MTGRDHDVPAVGTTSSRRGRPSSARTSRFSTPARRFPPEVFRRRRERLLERLGDGVAVLFGVKSTLDAWEERRFDPTFRIGGFRQEPNLWYLTGLELPGVAVVLDAATGEVEAFVPDPPEGAREELERLGLGAPLPVADFEGRVRERLRGRKAHLLVRSPAVASLRSGFGEESDFPSPLPGGTPGSFPDEQLAERCRKVFEPAGVESLLPPLLDLRRTKEPSELEAIRAATEATVEAFLAAASIVAPGVEELEVSATLQAGARRRGAPHDAFAPVVQSGADGMLSFVDVVDAYDGLNRTLEAGELALLDYGAELDYYVADLARTLPVSGTFSDNQRVAYEAYLRAYRAGIEALGPGRPFMDAAEATAREFEAMLPSLPGWLRPAAEAFASTAGRLRPGHFLGLELHDHERYHAPLRPGEVLAYEHHFRIPERGWRITVEDMLLVTDEGCEILSERLPREPDAIEALVGAASG